MNTRQFIWCLLPLGALLFHYAYGERLQYGEESFKIRSGALREKQSGRFDVASKRFDEAERAAHPDDLPLRARMRIDSALASIEAGNLTEATSHLDRLLAAKLSAGLPDFIVEEVQSTLALSLYYTAYALRLDLPDPEMWHSEADGARQIFLALYQSASQRKRPLEAAVYARNLEATIQLLRCRQAELASLPIPSPVRAALQTGLAAKRKADSEQ
jgi:hypothetical protein